MDEITLWPAHRLAEGIRRRDFSSRELLDRYLERIAKLNPPLNAVVTLDVAGARRAADAADAALARGDVLGPLHGIPMTVKDSFDTAGIRTTCGVREWDRVPDRDAHAVGRLRDAGAVIFGKTNVRAMAADWQTVNPIFGATNNPWDTSRSTGGSSGGAAAALAAGLTALELGSDIAGSIRLPANWCGVCGHKPSWGLVPQRGHLPPPPGALAAVDLAVMGPLARDVADLEMALNVLAGPAAADATGWRLELPPRRATALDRLRIALWLDDPAYPVEPDVAVVLQSAAAALADAGANLVEAAPPVSLSAVVRLHMELLYPLMDPSSTLSHRDWLVANERRARLRARMGDYFRQVDALVMPVAMMPAIAHDHLEPMADRVLALAGGNRSYLDLLGWVGLPTVAYLPATAVPVGHTADGLPVGVQVVGPYLDDRTTLAVAGEIQRLLGGFVPPPRMRGIP